MAALRESLVHPRVAAPSDGVGDDLVGDLRSRSFMEFKVMQEDDRQVDGNVPTAHGEQVADLLHPQVRASCRRSR